MHNPLTLFEEYIDRAGIIKILSSLRARGDYGRYDLLIKSVQDIITSEFDGAVWKYEYQGLVINRKGG